MKLFNFFVKVLENSFSVSISFFLLIIRNYIRLENLFSLDERGVVFFVCRGVVNLFFGVNTINFFAAVVFKIFFCLFEKLVIWGKYKNFFG